MLQPIIRKTGRKENANLLTLNLFGRHASVYFVFCLFDFRDILLTYSSLTITVEFSVRDFPLCPKHFVQFGIFKGMDIEIAICFFIVK